MTALLLGALLLAFGLLLGLRIAARPDVLPAMLRDALVAQIGLSDARLVGEVLDVVVRHEGALCGSARDALQRCRDDLSTDHRLRGGNGPRPGAPLAG